MVGSTNVPNTATTSQRFARRAKKTIIFMWLGEMSGNLNHEFIMTQPHENGHFILLSILKSLQAFISLQRRRG